MLIFTNYFGISFNRTMHRWERFETLCVWSEVFEGDPLRPKFLWGPGQHRLSPVWWLDLGCCLVAGRYLKLKWIFRCFLYPQPQCFSQTCIRLVIRRLEVRSKLSKVTFFCVMIMKYFLWLFSHLCRFKKGSCQFLVDQCAQVLISCIED